MQRGSCRMKKKRRRTPPGQQQYPSQPVGPELHRDHPGAAPHKGADDRSDPLKAGEEGRCSGGETQAKQHEAPARPDPPLPLLEREQRAIRQSANAQTLFWGASTSTATATAAVETEVSSSRQEMKSSFLCVCLRRSEVHVRHVLPTHSS